MTFTLIAYHYCRIKILILNCFKILTILILYFKKCSHGIRYMFSLNERLDYTEVYNHTCSFSTYINKKLVIFDSF